MSNHVPSGYAGRHRSHGWFAAAAAVAIVLALVQAPAGAASSPSDAEPSSTGPTAEEPGWTDDAVAAAEKARQTGERQELASARSANTTTFIEPSGSSTTEITESATRVERDGEWIDINPSLGHEDGVLVPEATHAEVEISDGRGIDEALAMVSKGSRSISLDWPGDLPPPEVENATATFDAGSARDVQVTATNAGFNLRVIVAKVPTSPLIYRIPVTTEGVRLEETEDGGFAANDPAGKTVFRIAPPVMWDRTQDGLEAGPEVVKPVDAEIVNDASGEQTLILRPDFAWMTDPARVLPITVDPDTYVVTNSGAKSTYISNQNASTSYSTAAMLRVGYDPQLLRGRAFVQFPIPQSLPSSITSASLKLYQIDATTCTPSTINVFPVNRAWSTTLTWNSALNSTPPVDVKAEYKVTADTSLTPDCKNQTQSIPVTPIVKAWMGGLPNYGFTMRADESTASAYKVFCSLNTNPNVTSCSQATRQPTLSITSNTPPSVPARLAESPASCDGANAPRVTSLTPTLRGVAADTDTSGTATLGSVGANSEYGHEAVRLKFEIWPARAVEYDDPFVVAADDPDGPLAPAAVGYSGYVEQSTQATWVVPGAALVEGGDYVWRALADDQHSLSPYSEWRSFLVDSSATPTGACDLPLSEVEEDSAIAALTGLSDAAPTEYAGVWSAEHHRFVLGAARRDNMTDAQVLSSARSAANSSLAGADLSPTSVVAAKGLVDIVPVDHSAAALRAIVDDIDNRVAAGDPDMPDLAYWGIDFSANVVTAGIVSAAETSADSDAVGTFAVETNSSPYLESLYGSALRTEDASDTSVAAGDGAWPYHDKQPPYFGGDHISILHDSGKLKDCTLGPALKVTATGQVFGTTAGHCAKAAAYPDVYNTNPVTNETFDRVGALDQSKFGTVTLASGAKVGIDTTLIRNGTSGKFAPRAWVDGFVFMNKLRWIHRGVGAAAKADAGRVCMWGAKSGHECRLEVSKTGIIFDAKDDYDNSVTTLRDVVEVKPTSPGVCAILDGDSGGYVYKAIKKGSRAGQIQILGFLTGGSCERLFYTPIRHVEKYFGAKLLLAKK